MIPPFEQQYIESVNSGVALLDDKGVIRAVNALWKKIAVEQNWPANTSCIGLHYQEFCHKIDVCDANLDEAIGSIAIGKSDAFQRQFKRPVDGRETWLEVRVEAYSGSIEGLLVQHEDITQRIEVKEKLREINFHEKLFECLNEGVLFQNAQGVIEHANPAAEKILGLPLSRLQGTSGPESCWRALNELGREIDSQEHPAMLALRSGDTQENHEMGIQTPEGEFRWLRVTSQLLQSPSGEVKGVLSSFFDCTKERNQKTALQSSAERLKLAIDSAKIGIWEWRPAENTMEWDEQMYALYGYRSNQGMATKEVWRIAIHPEDKDRIELELRSALRSRDDLSSDFRVIWPDQSIHHLRAQARVVRSATGKLERLVGVNWDITKEVNAEKRLQEMAYHDELTGIANRASFNFRLSRAIARARRANCYLGVLVMDLDHFKDVNDTFGHPLGDSLLVEVVKRLTPLLRTRDTFARLGGDEFAVLLENMEDPQEARDLANRLQEGLQEPLYLVNGPAVTTQVSIGISIYPDDGNDAIELVKSADLAMYSAKKKGRNAITAYTKGMTTALTKKVTLEYLLREAIRDEEFQLHYQPIVSMGDNKVIGCEALIRWQDRRGKFIPPFDFIPVAEDCGLIYEMGKWINNTALKQWKLWQQLVPDLQYVSINVSPMQLHSADFLDDLEALVAANGVRQENVQLEITEGTFLQESMSAESQLARLGELGYRLAIDDFGTGYSSLAYLKRFNVDVIKIDRSFIIDIETNKADQDIVTAILAMTNSLGFATLVEGIEGPNQCSKLAELGCQFAQGYFFGRPTYADEFAELYIKNSCGKKQVQ